VLDGVYQRSDAGPVFVEVLQSTDEDGQVVLHRMCGGLCAMSAKSRNPRCRRGEG
jgi:hypothetical protein